MVGSGFSVLLGAAYSRRRLEDIRVGSFAAAGAGVAGLLSTLIGVFVIGSASSIGFLATTFAVAAVLGGATAGGTLKIAQLPSSRLEDGLSTGLPDVEDQARIAGGAL